MLAQMLIQPRGARLLRADPEKRRNTAVTHHLAALPDARAGTSADRGAHYLSVEASPGGTSWLLEVWPQVPTRFLLCRDDRFFPTELMRRVVREMLGIIPDEMDGSHCVALSRPKQLADRLETYGSSSRNLSHGR